MPQAQAFVQTCDDFRIQKPLADFLENTLNLYATDLKTDMGGTKEIFDGSEKREWIFENIKASVEQHQINRVILVNHTDCAAYGGSDAFKTQEDEIHTHEIQLRHAVSDVKAKFPKMEVEAYLMVLGGIDEPITINKVI